MCCNSGQRSPKNGGARARARAVATAQSIPAAQKGIALKLANQAAAQASQQFAKKNPSLIQNRAM